MFSDYRYWIWFRIVMQNVCFLNKIVFRFSTICYENKFRKKLKILIGFLLNQPTTAAAAATETTTSGANKNNDNNI